MHTYGNITNIDICRGAIILKVKNIVKTAIKVAPIVYPIIRKIVKSRKSGNKGKTN